MKIFLLFVLFTVGGYSQSSVFNVQQYCIDELPFKKDQCDISGTEYSFVFLDTAKNEVVLFLTSMKFKYQLISSTKVPNFTVYKLKDGESLVEMKVNIARTKVEFLYPDRHIVLTVGKSTKKV